MSMRSFFGFVLGGNRLLHKVGFVMLSMQKNEGYRLQLKKGSLFYSHPAPRFVKES